MKKYAAHRLYYAPHKYQGQSVVVLNKEGTVHSFCILEEETNATEWVGGIIILSTQADISSKEDYKDLLAQQDISSGQCLYAWHLSHFDFINEIPTKESVLIRLR